MEIFRRNHFELKIKTISPAHKEDSPIYLYVSKYFDIEDKAILELSYFSENLSLAITLPAMPTNQLDKEFSSDFIIKHRVSSYLLTETKDLDTIYQDFYENQKSQVSIANTLALDTLKGVPLETNPIAKAIIASPVAWIVFCHAMKTKAITSQFMKFVIKHNEKAFLDPVFDILPFVYEEIDIAF